MQHIRHLFDWVGPAQREFDRCVRVGVGGARLLIEDVWGWNIVYYEKCIYAIKQGVGPFSKRLSDGAFDSIIVCIEFIIRKENIGADSSPLFQAFGFIIYFKSNSFVALRQYDHCRFVQKLLYDLIDKLKQIRDNNLEITIHIGLPKTATTYLQKNFFPYISGVHFLDSSAIFFQLDFQQIKFMCGFSRVKQIQEGFKKYLNTFDEYYLFISDESLTNPWDKGKAFGASILSLKELFPNAKIIISLREQVSMLSSLYSQSLRRGWSLSPKRFIGWNRGSKTFIDFDVDLFPHIDLAYFKYKELLNILRSIFYDVNIVLYEKFVSDQDVFFKKIALFLGGDYITPSNVGKHENRRLGLIGVWLFRILNPLIPNRCRDDFVKLINRLDQTLHIPFKPFSDDIVKELRSYFFKSNISLSEEWIPEIVDCWKLNDDTCKVDSDLTEKLCI